MSFMPVCIAGSYIAQAEADVFPLAGLLTYVAMGAAD